MNKAFQNWFEKQDFFANLRFIHGDKIFIADNGVYRVLAVQISWLTWQQQQNRIDVALQAKKEGLIVQLKGAEERAQLALQYKDKYCKERDVLQKRIDEALKISEKMAKGTNSVAMFSYELHQALKGDIQ